MPVCGLNFGLCQRHLQLHGHCNEASPRAWAVLRTAGPNTELVTQCQLWCPANLSCCFVLSNNLVISCGDEGAACDLLLALSVLTVGEWGPEGKYN